MYAYNAILVSKLQPLVTRGRSVYAKLYRRIESREFRRALAVVKFKGVAGLISANIAAYMLLNSHMMKVRSASDGLSRTDRHFVASRFNLSHFRFWCVPLSIVNHGDSLFHLGMNCFALGLVGPAIEIAFGGAALVGGFIFTGSVGALCELWMGNHWCRGSSGGSAGLFAAGALVAPSQLLSVWGMFDVRAMPLALTVFGIECLFGLLGNHSGMAHMAHAGGMAAALPFMYYLKWFSRR